MAPTTEDTLRELLHLATEDLHAPAPKLAPVQTLRAPRRRWPLLLASAVATAAAATVVAALVTSGTGNSPGMHPAASRPTSSAIPGTTGAGHSTQPTPALVGLAAAVKTLPAATGRYAVQIERQSEGDTTYLKASVVDSQTGHIWTYQQGGGVPATLPEASGPTQAQVNGLPTDPTALSAALLSQAGAAASTRSGAESVVFTQALDDLWNPLLQPPLRSALLNVISGIPGVTIDAHTTDATGRPSIETSYRDPATGTVSSLYLDPSNGFVNEGSIGDVGQDVYLSLTRSDGPPTVDPLTGAAPQTAPTAGTATTGAGTPAGRTTVWFESPSGNINCEMVDATPATTGVDCQALSPAQSVTLSATGVVQQCPGVRCLGNPPAGTKTLASGQVEHLGPFTCSSATTGVTCSSGGGRFTISRSGITTTTARANS